MACGISGHELLAPFFAQHPFSYRQRFTLRHAHIELAATASASIDKLRSMFHPDGAFGLHLDRLAGPADDLDWKIYDFLADTAGVESLFERVRAGAGAVGSYRPEPFVSLPAYRLSDGEVFSASRAGEPPALIFRLGKEIAIVSGPDASHALRAMRVLRHLGARLAYADGAIALHASAFERGGLVFLIVGDSGAGKSTLSIAAPLFGGGAWVGNDRLFVDLANDALACSAYPLPLGVNRGSLHALGLERDYPGWTLSLPVPDESSDWARHCGETKLKLTPREVEQILRIPAAASAPLGGIFFPGVQPGFGRAQVQQAAIQDVSDVLLRNTHSAESAIWGDDYLGVGEYAPAPPFNPAALLSALSRRPIWVCTMYRYEDAELIARSIDTLLSGEAAVGNARIGVRSRQ